MENLTAQSRERKISLAAGAMYVEEAKLISELLSRLDPETESPEILQKEVDEGFLRLDMNYGSDVKENSIELLSQMWEVENTEDLVDTFDFLIKQGHRGKFKSLLTQTSDRDKFRKVFEFDFLDSDQVALSDQDLDSLIDWLVKAEKLITGPGILAWDLARAVHITRLGFLAELIDEKQAWKQIDQVYPAMQGQFKDWKHFAQSYLIGLTFWAGQEDPYVKSCCERLLGEPEVSPWGFYPISV